jgi:hypothetical protein
MNPFIHLPNYGVIVCVGPKCKYAVLPIHVDSYLSNACHNYNKEQQEQVIQEINQIGGLIQDARGLELFVFPKPNSPAIPELRAVILDGLQCKLCSHICWNERRMQAHCKDIYKWVND